MKMPTLYWLYFLALAFGVLTNGYSRSIEDTVISLNLPYAENNKLFQQISDYSE